MNLPAALYAIFWLIRDTFRQGIAGRTFWVMLSVSVVCIVLCLSLRVERGPALKDKDDIELYDPATGKPATGPLSQKAGRVTLAFGAVNLPLGRDVDQGIHLFQVVLAQWVAGAAGTMLALICTAGFLPEFLQPGNASVLLAKPVPRWSLLLGKYLGVLAFLAFHATLFFGGTYLAIGLRTDVWFGGYLLCIPLLILNFAVVYSFSTVLAVLTRNTVACFLGSILFWLVCCAINWARISVLTLPYMTPSATFEPPPGFEDVGPTVAVAPPAGATPHSKSASTLVEISYWIMPKPIDLVLLIDQAVKGGEHLHIPQFELLWEKNLFEPVLSVLTSILFSVAMIAIAARQLVTAEY